MIEVFATYKPPIIGSSSIVRSLNACKVASNGVRGADHNICFSPNVVALDLIDAGVAPFNNSSHGIKRCS